MFPDRSIIQRHERFAVAAQRCEVMWRDGTSVVLHPVLEQGIEATHLRAMRGADGGWFVFNVTRVLPTLGDDLRLAHPRDHQGLIFYSLRLRFPTAAEFARRAAEVFIACWHPLQEAA